MFSHTLQSVDEDLLRYDIWVKLYIMLNQEPHDSTHSTTCLGEPQPVARRGSAVERNR